jgi:hypothetical protein
MAESQLGSPLRLCPVPHLGEGIVGYRERLRAHVREQTAARYMLPARRLTAILAADVAGYSRLMGADEEGTHSAPEAAAHFEGGIDGNGGRAVASKVPNPLRTRAAARFELDLVNLIGPPFVLPFHARH